jgi:hypothetical protein
LKVYFVFGKELIDAGANPEYFRPDEQYWFDEDEIVEVRKSKG